MILIVCIDDRGGLLFNNRRLSSDKAVVQDMFQYTQIDKICIAPYSLPLFGSFEDRVTVSEQGFDNGMQCCFAEKCDFLSLLDAVDRLIVYKWNRCYPSDTKFPFDAFKQRLKLSCSYDFEGTSHSCITREVYVR